LIRIEVAELHNRRKVMQICLACVVLAVLSYGSIELVPKITELASDLERFRRVILSYGHLGVLIFIGIQILQIVVAAIPGEVIQIAGGYIYGTELATLYLLTGMIIGTFGAFGLSRLVGYPLVRLMVSADKLIYFRSLMTSSKANLVLFFLFLVPGLPKDVLTYVGGLTPVKPLSFVLVTTIARIPGVFLSAYLGENLLERDYTTVIVISVIAVALFVFGLIKRELILNLLQRISHALQKHKK